MHVPQIAPEASLKPYIPKFSWGSMPHIPLEDFGSLSMPRIKVVPYNLTTQKFVTPSLINKQLISSKALRGGNLS